MTLNPKNLDTRYSAECPCCGQNAYWDGQIIKESFSGIGLTMRCLHCVNSFDDFNGALQEEFSKCPPSFNPENPLQVPVRMPPDFEVTYQWREASIPPPDHYEYSVYFKLNERVRIRFMPDYPSDKTETWEAYFPITKGELENLYSLMRVTGAFRLHWQTDEKGPKGGSSDWLISKAHDREFTIPSSLLAGDRNSIQPVITWIKAGLPYEIWNQGLIKRFENYKNKTN